TNWQEPIPGGPPPVGVGAGGTLTTRPNRNQQEDNQYECDRDRMALAMIDNERYFRDLFGQANRANVSFYPIDPRGLVALESPIGPAPPPTLTQDDAAPRAAQDALGRLAENSDRFA